MMKAARSAVIVLVVALGATASHASVTISNDPTSNMNCSSGVCTPTAADANLNVGDLVAMLAASDVAVNSNAMAPDIGITAPLGWTSTHGLTLDAFGSIRVGAPVMVEGTSGLTLASNSISFLRKRGYVEFWDLNSKLTINRQAFVLVGDVASLARDVAAHQFGSYALAKSYDASVDGTYSEAPVSAVFSGTFEGLGNEISNLSIYDTSQDGYVYVGLFSELQNYAWIRDITLDKIHAVSGYFGVGGLVGVIQGGSISSSYVTGTLKSLRGSSTAVGGLVGGISNITPSAIVNSGARVTIIAHRNSFAGGLVGEMDGGLIDQSWSEGSVEVRQSRGMQPSGSAGGLVGYNFLGTILDCYSTASATAGKGANAGGLVGVTYSLLGGPIENSYAAGVTASRADGYGGGLIGYASYPNLGDNYWDLDTSGISNPAQGVGNMPNASGVTGLTTLELQTGLPQGFSKSIWHEKARVNNGLPYLLANPPQ